MKVQELENRFKEIDERSKSEPVKVNLAAGTESSGNMNVTVERKVRANLDRDESTSSALGEVNSVQSETLLDVNLGDVDIPDEYIKHKIYEVFSNRDTIGALAQPELVQVGATENWKLMKDYSYDVGGYTITALSGFIYDRASIPAIFWPLISKDSLSSAAPLFHDLLYRYGGALPKDQVPPQDGEVMPYKTFQRKAVDKLFLELMKKSNVTPWRANAAYQAVHNFARWAWKG